MNELFARSIVSYVAGKSSTLKASRDDLCTGYAISALKRISKCK